MEGVARILRTALRIAFVISVLFILPIQTASANFADTSQSTSTACSSVVDISCTIYQSTCDKRLSNVVGGENQIPTPVVASVKHFAPPQNTSNTQTESQNSATSQTPTPSSASVQSVEPTANLNFDTIFHLVNEHRKSIGLSPFEKDDKLCQLAASRGPELPQEIANGALHSGLYNRNLPYWVTENMKYGGDEAEAVRWWLASPIHRAAIEGDSKYSCGTCNGTICEELFTSYVPK